MDKGKLNFFKSCRKDEIPKEKDSAKKDLGNLLGYEGKLLKNIELTLKNGDKIFIDEIFITAKGIFVIDSKNYYGHITGDENAPRWTEALYAGRDAKGKIKLDRREFYNPVRQNNSYIKALKKYLGEDVPFFSVVTFPDKCEFKELKLDSGEVSVCKRRDLSDGIGNIFSCCDDVLDKEEMGDIYEMLYPLSHPEKAVKKKPAPYERKLSFKDKEKTYEKSDVCPACGGRLVIKRAKSGLHAGERFYGCSNFPKCKYFKEIKNKTGK